MKAKPRLLTIPAPLAALMEPGTASRSYSASQRAKATADLLRHDARSILAAMARLAKLHAQ